MLNDASFPFATEDTFEIVRSKSSKTPWTVVELELSNIKQKKKQVSIPCPNCQVLSKYKPYYIETILKFPSTEKVNDPYFNLPLWFQSEIKGNAFWAFNREHLAEIKTYVQSKLRERQSTYTTMVEKLPKFITDSKNREAVIKSIEKLEIKRA